jgi:hypothetical protein
MKAFPADKQFSLLNKLRTTGLLLDKKQKHYHRVFSEEKLDDIGTKLEHTPRKSLKRLAQETGVSKSNTWTDTQLLKLSSESLSLVCCKGKKDCCTCVFYETVNSEKYLRAQRTVFSTSVFCELLTTSFQTISAVRHADSSAKFACASQQGAEPWTPQVTKKRSCRRG